MINVFFNDEVLGAEEKICTSLSMPSIILMENAGINSADHILKRFKDLIQNEVIIITGKGNNAGDGFVIARHLINSNVKVKILTLFREKDLRDDAFLNYNILKNQKNEKLRIIYCSGAGDVSEEIHSSNKLIIDSIFGTGFKGVPDKRMKDIFNLLNNIKGAVIVSIDTPSGLYNYDQNTESIKADVTLTMGVKKFHSLFYNGREHTGNYELINIGIPGSEFTKFNIRKIFETEETDVRAMIPVRNKNSNKYSSGRVFILSGSVGLTGAAYLCSMAALRTGSGAVITGVPESLNHIMEIKMTEVMTMPLPETDQKTLSVKCYEAVREKAAWADAVLLGPGLSKNEETMDLVRKTVKDNDFNFVIDADAIYAFRGNLSLLKRKKIIMTPHFGEFANLIGKDTVDIKDNFFDYAESFALEYGVVLVLKNSPTVVTDGKSFYINSSGKENLATAGTGDVLSGIIAGLYSQSRNIIESAVAGVYIHGKCGDRLYQKDGASSTLAGDLLDIIPEVKKELSDLEN